MHFQCPNCEHPIEVVDQLVADGETLDSVTCPSCQSRFSWSREATLSLEPALSIDVGHFEIRRQLGEGAFGTVYHAWDPKLLRDVAIKVPRRDRITRDSVRVFLKEAQSAARVRHANVVQVYEVGHREEQFYIVSEYIDGISLSEWLRMRQPSLRHAVELFLAICKGVQAAHEAGVIHRDLKPGNILMDSANQPHVADFGLARTESAGEMTVTQDGRIMGTPAYMSPEQARGDNAATSHLSDIFSLGVTFYEILTAQRPFRATTSHTVMYRILTEEPTAPRKVRKEIPRDLETIVLQAMQKEPSRRYQSVADIVGDLQRFLDGKPISARPIGLIEKASRFTRRNPMIAALSLMATVLVAVVLFQATREPVQVMTPGKTIIVAPDAQPLPVRIQYTLSGDRIPSTSTANWAAIPIKKETREPMPESATHREGVTSFEASLIPGEYLIVVDVIGHGFHEVYRTVPTSQKQEPHPAYNHLYSTIDEDQTIRLPDIQVRNEEATRAGMVEVPGGDFDMGDDKAFRRRHRRSVQSFLMDPTEVTCDQYFSGHPLPERYTLPDGNFPVADVTWHAAMVYAESIGKRLPTEAEFEYAATNRGRSEFPWGDDLRPADGSWAYAEAGQPATDRLPDLSIFGLHSNVAEWTDSLLNPYPSATQINEQGREFMNLYGSRVVRGGPVTLGQNDRTPNTWTENARFRSAWLTATYDSEIGFRCVRSIQPRFVKAGRKPGGK